MPRPSDTSPSRSLAYTRRALAAADLFAPVAAYVGSLLVALRPAHPASGMLGHFRPLRSRHVDPQLPRHPAVRQRIGTTAESTAVRHHLHRSEASSSSSQTPLLALLPRSPSSPSSCRRTRRSSPCPSSRRPTTRPGALPWRRASASSASSALSQARRRSRHRQASSRPRRTPRATMSRARRPLSSSTAR
jgi:hypothetical protein